jgi:hypothetical protein
MLAWFSSSLNMRSFFCARIEIIPRFAMYPVGKINEACFDLCCASLVSNLLNKTSLPAISLELD